MRATRRAPRQLLIGSAIAMLGAVALLLGSTGIASAEMLPPLHVVYEGSFLDTSEYKEANGETGTAEEEVKWSATGVTAGAAEPQPLVFTEITGKYKALTTLKNGVECTPGAGAKNLSEYKPSIAPKLNPESGAWSVEEIDGYPSPGWRYEIPDSAAMLPWAWSQETAKGTSCASTYNPPEGFPSLSVREFAAGGLPGGCPPSPAQAAKLEALFEPVKWDPRSSTTAPTRTFEEQCTPPASADGTTFTFKVKTTLTALVSSSSAPPPQAPNVGPRSEGQTPAQLARKKDKERAKARLPREWQWAVTLENARSGLLGAIATKLAPAAQETFNDDFKAVKDPPLSEDAKLAVPAAVMLAKPAACRSAAGSCATLRAHELGLFAESAKVEGITRALYTTISRMTAAINSGASSAASKQASHYSDLEKELKKAFAAQARDGSAVAGLLRKDHVNGVLSQASDARATTRLESALAKDGIGAAELTPVLGSVLTPTRTNALTVLAHGEG